MRKQKTTTKKKNKKKGVSECSAYSYVSWIPDYFVYYIAEGGEKETIIDNTETNLVALRRTIYLTIQSSLDFEECAHKLMKMELKPGQEVSSNY